MRLVSFDFETFRLRAGLAAPTAVCLSWDDGETQGVVLADVGLNMLEAWLLDPEVILLGQNIVYDLTVAAAERPRLLKIIFAVIKAGRARCTLLREKIIAIARGELKYTFDEDTGEWRPSGFDLDRISRKRLGLKIEGKKKKKGESDPWRLRFGELHGIPVAEWPGGQEPGSPYDYSLVDSVRARAIYLSQREEIIVESDGDPELVAGEPTLACEVSEVLVEEALNLQRSWGLRTDPEAVAEFRAEVQVAFDAACEQAFSAGLMRWGGTKKAPKLVKTMSAIRARIVRHFEGHDLEIALTDKGQVATDREQLRNLKHKGVAPDPDLVAVAEVGRLGKLLTTYVPILERGVSVPITPEYNTPIETIRVSCRRPNVMNFPRSGDVRQCFVPREGWVYVFCDFSTIEMRTLAQTCIDLFGYSALADAINAGRDIHLDLAANILGIPYEEALARYERGDQEVEQTRQLAKCADFGYPGGMSATTFIDYAREQGIEVSFDLAQTLHEGFRQKWPEMVEYFRYVEALLDDDEDGVETLVSLRSGFVRGKVRYTAACNHSFQHLAACGAKAALSRAIEEMYCDEDSPLFGCRSGIFAHDEIGMEVPIAAWGAERASAAADRLERVMVEEMKVWVPDVSISATPVMMRRWLKGARPVRQNGILVPSKPEKRDGRTVWVADVEEVRRAA